MDKVLEIAVRGACGKDCKYPDCYSSGTCRVHRMPVERDVKDALAALSAAGLRIVPVEATEAMIDATRPIVDRWDFLDGLQLYDNGGMAELYRALLAGGTDAKP